MFTPAPQTTHIPWLPKSQGILTFTRQLINRAFPHLRRQSTLPFHDGPLAKQVPQPVVMHGVPLAPDPYAYMADLNDRETLAYLKAEMRHYSWVESKLDFKSGKHRIWAELDARVVVTTREGGFDKGEERIGDHIYFTRALQSDTSDIAFYRKKLGETDLLAEQLINPHELMKQLGYAHCQIGICRVSENGKMLAYTLSVEGGDRYICHVRTIDNAAIFHVIRSTNIVSIEFGSANNFFYTECNELNRPYRVMLQELRPGLLPEPVEIYRDDDEMYFVDVRKTKDGKFLTISSDAKSAGNVLVVPSSYPNIPKELKPLFPTHRPIEIAGKEAWGWLEHHGNCFVMVTSKDAPNYKIVYQREEVVLRDGKAAQWLDLVPHNDKVQISDVDIFKSNFVLFESTFGFEKSSALRILDISKGLESPEAQDRSNDKLVHFPALAYITPGLNKNFEQETMGFTYSNIVTPARDCVYQLVNRMTPTQVRMMSPHHLYTTRQHENFTPWDYMWPYHMYRDVLTSADGTDIPITICQKRDLFVDEITEADPLANSPRYCLLYVYGSYGEVPALHFQLAPYMWLIRRRWVVAFAHCRGGGEQPGWPEAGKGRNKPNTVSDFVATCEWLIKQGFTTAETLVVAGNSAGAVPIAAAMNMRGNTLFSLALLRAPFLDIINTMANPELPLTIAEREDWGDPVNNAEDLKVLKSYDPYYNINDRVTYPSMIVSACLDDDRVPAWNALKYVAKIRQQRSRKPNVDPIANPILLRLLSTGGHYLWNQNAPLSEEVAYLANMYDIPGPGAKFDDLDTMQQLTNYFDSGLMDHDDQTQTFLKWDTWERERIDFVSKMHKYGHEPNFRVLLAKKDPYYWSNTSREDPILQAPPAEANVKSEPWKHQRNANMTLGDRKR